MLQKIKSTEKIVKMIEITNTLVFETDRQFRKEAVKKEVENLFDVKVEKIRSHNRRNKKLFFVKLKPEFHAIDVATKLGLI